jgi:hypothetical protein
MQYAVIYAMIYNLLVGSMGMLEVYYAKETSL